MDALDNTNTEVVENNSMQADPIVEAPATETPDAPVIADSNDSEDAPEWKPNFKVKAYDKEFEIPEKFRGLITKENEADFRDAFEKAYALDVMKEKNQKIRETNEQYQKRIETEYAPKLQRFEKLAKFIEKDDFDSFVENSNIPGLEEKMQKWMLRRLQLRDLPPEQQALYNDARAAQVKAYQLEEENAGYKQQFAQLSQEQQAKQVDAQLNDLDNYVAQPGIEEVAKSFDTRLGQDGSFKLEVLRRAAVVAQQQQREVTVKEAVDDFVKMLGGTQAAPTLPNQNGQAPQVQTPKPTLPNLQGKATSPAIQKVKSLDDLKKLSKQAIANASRASRE